MAKEKMYYSWNIPASVVYLVNAICADYERRQRAIKYSTVTGAVLERYIQLNSVIDQALSEVEVSLRADLLQDITAGRGYTKSSAQYLVSKNAYYRRRRKLIHDIATELSLL